MMGHGEGGKVTPENKELRNTPAEHANVPAKFFDLPAQPVDGCALNAFHISQSFDISEPALNHECDIQAPAGKRLVIELITARIYVAQGYSVSLLLSPRLTTPTNQINNLALTVSLQGVYAGKALYVATHSVRTYSDGVLSFNIECSDQIAAYADFGISGYTVDL